MPVLAIFEVMDKEPSLLALAAVYGVLCATAYVGSRKRWWLGLLLLPFVGLVNNVAELRDPYVGPAILQEAGWPYVAMSYAMLLAAVALPIIAAFRQRNIQRLRSLAINRHFTHNQSLPIPSRFSSLLQDDIDLSISGNRHNDVFRKGKA